MAIKVVKTKPIHTDERGDIFKLVENEKIFSVLRITHKAGSPPRANHYHKKDFHWVYIESGKMKYSEKPFKNKNAKVETVILKPGDLVLTKPGIIHAMEATEDTVFWAITTEGRKQANYEKDTIRIKIV